MKKGVIVAATALMMASGLAMAATAEQMPAQQTTPAAAQVPVNAQELHHFAAAVKQIQPIDMKAHAVIENKKMSESSKKMKLAGYDKQITTVLAHHHLTPVKYETLLKKAETDPAFAKRTESALQQLG